jgi:hypothetical protein
MTRDDPVDVTDGMGEHLQLGARKETRIAASLIPSQLVPTSAKQVRLRQCFS